MNRVRRWVAPTAAVLLLMAEASAAQSGRPRPPVTVGAAVVASPSPYAGIDEPPLTAVPFVNFELGRFYLRGLEAGYRVWQRGPLSLAAVVQPRFQSYHAGDSPALTGMADRRRTAEGGARASLRLGRFEAGLRAVTDLLGRHGGQEITADVGWRLGGPRLSLSPSVGVVWESADFVDYYYGVRPGEATADRPAYAGDAAINPFAALAARYRLSKRWGLFGLVRHTWLDQPVTDSPIVDSATNNSGVLAVTFAFGV